MGGWKIVMFSTKLSVSLFCSGMLFITEVEGIVQCVYCKTTRLLKLREKFTSLLVYLLKNIVIRA